MRTERIWIKKTITWMQVSRQVRNLYNVGNYIIKYQLEKSKYFTDMYELINILRYHPAFEKLPVHTAQQTIKFLCHAWKSYFKAVKEYRRNPQKFMGEPKPPKYKKKNGFATIYFTNYQVRIKKDQQTTKTYLYFPKRIGGKVETRLTPETKLKFARVIPKGTAFLLELVYEVEREEQKPSTPQRVLALDLGVNNLVTGLTNINKERGFLINGRPLKAINQWFNKRKAELQEIYANQDLNDWGQKMLTLLDSRKKKMDDYMHKASRKIVNYCEQKNIDTIVIGYNKKWKQKVNMGKQTNQTFVYIPFQSLIHKIKYKAEEKGITVEVVEEKYTSKCSFIDSERIKKHLRYRGKRLHRGLFRSAKGLILNADIKIDGEKPIETHPCVFPFIPKKIVVSLKSQKSWNCPPEKLLLYLYSPLPILPSIVGGKDERT